ncbi:BON domain-containing protein [Oxalobacter vibrioformis]|uniref:Osmotically-inducible protein Y n=1 Tax=Oxalobacter vibrioformis TaxID=933080 RepID=A0A9E9LV04_9BURK|nr:BON domain-containing protein [Oxalobacter vibrioformis]WAW09364.1 BON domain-containing protein [Oxalobacter vibrioformis]
MKVFRYACFAFFALLVASLSACSTGQKHGTVGQYVEDSAITTNVKAAIFQESDLSAAEINVETFNGIVQLSGFVSQSAQISKAGQVAQRVEGVKGVKNSLTVKR